MHVITLLLIEWEFISIINCTCYSVTYMGTRPLNKGTNRPITPCTVKLFIQLMYNKYRLFNVLCWLWNIYEGAELPSVYFITNTKHCITYLALAQLFPVLISHPEMYTLCSILLHFV